MWMRIFPLTLLLSFSVFAADSLLYGTWKMNLAKSEYKNAPDTPTGATLVAHGEGNKDILDFDGSMKSGKSLKMRLTQPTAGGPVTANPEDPEDKKLFDTAIYKVIDDHHMEYEYLKNGKHVATRYINISKDGKVSTAKFSIKMPDGKTMVMNDYMERQ